MMFWLSFSGKDGFRGGCLVPGDDVKTAIRVAHLCGCNPGGEVLSQEVDPECPIAAQEVCVLFGLEGCQEFNRNVAARKAALGIEREGVGSAPTREENNVW